MKARARVSLALAVGIFFAVAAAHGSAGQDPRQARDALASTDRETSIERVLCESSGKMAGRQEHPATLGVGVSAVTPALAQKLGAPDAKGALVRSVIGCSPADLAGVKVGDVIRQFNGKPIQNADALVSMVKSAPATVTLGILRGGRPMNLQATLQSSATPERVNSDTLIVPSQRVGKVFLGETFGQVNDNMPRKVHGHADADRSHGELTGRLVCEYENAGLQAEFYAPSVAGKSDAGYDLLATARAVGIQVGGFDREAESYATSKGIHLDSSRRDVLKAYGQPSREHEEKIGGVVNANGSQSKEYLGVDVLDYEILGISFAVAGKKGDPSEVVVTIRVYKPGTKLELPWD